MNTRFLGDTEYQAIKAAFRTLLKAAGGPIRAAEEITRTDPARLSRYGNVNETMFAPVDVIADLEAEVGEPIVTKILADMAGFVLVPKAQATASLDLDHHIAAVARETSDVLGELADAKRNGVTNKSRARQHIREAEEALANLDADLERVDSVVPLRRVQSVEG